jgi:hypothetical protein
MALFKPVLIIKKNILVLEFSVLHLLHSFPMSSEKTLQFTYEKKIIKQKDKKVENNFISGKKNHVSIQLYLSHWPLVAFSRN